MANSDDEVEVLKRLVNSPELLDKVAAGAGTELRRQSELRAQYDPDLVRAAFTLVDLRSRARAKFSRAGAMWLDRIGLEQATAEAVARHKAARFVGGPEPVYDWCCGIGADSIALALAGLPVISIDRSAAACRRTQLNAEVYGVSDRIETRVADVTSLPIPDALVHLDPDRRTGRQRAVRLEDYSPSLEFMDRLIHEAPGGAIKLSPASNFGGKFVGCEIELVSLHGECKEATVWFGSLAKAEIARATILPSGFSLAGNPGECRPQVGSLGAFVFDPDPAIVRAGLLDLFAEQLGLQRLDAAEEYLTASRLVESPALSAFELLAELPYNERELRRYFRSCAFGEVEIKARHVPVDVESLRRQLPLIGTGKAALIIARLQGRTRALVCRRSASLTG